MRKIKTTTTNIKKMLAEWDAEIPESILQQQQQRQLRRVFLGQSVALMGGFVAAGLVSVKAQTKVGSNPALSEPWLTVAAVQEHLFPRVTGEEASPGASDIHALEYLQVMLNTPDADSDEGDFIIKGVSWLDGVANNMVGRSFIKLNKVDRERVLKKIAASTAGENWLSMLLNYIFEALLSDPVYGGNTNKTGWQWLEHQAGFPRPPADKKYWLLAKKTGGIK